MRFRTKRDAVLAEQQGKDSRQRSKAGLPQRRESIRYETLVQKFMRQHQERSKVWKQEMLAYSVNRFGAVYLKDLQSDRIAEWLHGLPYAPKTKQHILDSMRQVLGAGMEWGYIDQNPARAAAVKAPRRIGACVQPFESWEEVHRMAVAAGRYEALVRFGCATGLRPEEWIALTWADVDFKARTAVVNKVCVDGVIYSDQGKTDSAFRRVHLQQQALDALHLLARPLSRSDLIFAAPNGGLINLDNWRRRVWIVALDSCGLDRRPLYQMRHTYATLALSAKADIYWLSKQLGHKDIRTTLKYYARFQRIVDERNLDLLDDFAATAEAGVAKADSEGGAVASTDRKPLH